MKLHIIWAKEDFFQKSPNCFATILRPYIMPNLRGELHAGFNLSKALCNSKQKDLNSGGLLC